MDSNNEQPVYKVPYELFVMQMLTVAYLRKYD